MLDRVFFVGLDLLAVVLPISIAATNIVFFPLAALWLFGAQWTFPKWRPVWGWPERLFLIYLGVSIVSALLGINMAHSVREIKNKDFYILIAIVLVALVRDQKHATRLLRIFMIAGLFTAVWGLIQCAVGVNMADKSDATYMHVPAALAHWPHALLVLLTMINGRVLGTRGHPIAYAECLLFNWAFAFCFLLICERRDLLKWLTYIAFIGGGLLVSQSRGPWFAAAVIAAVAMLCASSNRRWLIVGLGAVFLIFFATVPALRTRAVSVTDRAYNSNKERVHMWRAGYQIWKTHPLFGVGPGNVKVLSVPFQTPEEAVWGPWGHLHSTYVNFLSERGLCGLLAYFLFMGAIIAELWQALRRSIGDPWRAAVFEAALLGILGFFISGLTETAYNTAVVMMTFYFVMGLTLSLARHAESASSAVSRL